MPEYVCPRCGAAAEQRFYGPCEACRAQLRLIEPPAPDPDFVQVSLPNGNTSWEYQGPRVDDPTRAGAA